MTLFSYEISIFPLALVVLFAVISSFSKRELKKLWQVIDKYDVLTETEKVPGYRMRSTSVELRNVILINTFQYDYDKKNTNLCTLIRNIRLFFILRVALIVLFVAF